MSGLAWSWRLFRGYGNGPIAALAKAWLFRTGERVLIYPSHVQRAAVAARGAER